VEKNLEEAIRFYRESCIMSAEADRLEATVASEKI